MPKGLINSIIGGLFAIIAYFLSNFHTRLTLTEKDISDRVTQVEKETAANRAAIDLVSQESKFKSARFEEKIDDLKTAIVELTNELKSKK